MRTSKEEELSKRFFWLNTCVTIVLFVAIVVSVVQFGAEAWKGQRHVGLVLSGEKFENGWNREQYKGLQAACNTLGYELLVQEHAGEGEADCRMAVQALSEKQARVIFVANMTSLNGMKRVAEDYPNIRFFGTEMEPSDFAFNRYGVRYIEPCYLAGILAGLRTKTGRVGYVAPRSGPGFNQAVNAFAMGVHHVNPQAEIFLAWTGSWENREMEEQVVRDFKAVSVDAMSYFQDGDTLPAAAEQAGIYFISLYEKHPEYSHEMGTIRVDWKKMYLDMLRQHLREFDRAVYWATSLNHSVDIEARIGALSARERAVYETEYWEVQQGKIVFSGEIYDGNGVQRCGPGESISNQSLAQMNWIIKGVKVIGN